MDNQPIAQPEQQSVVLKRTFWSDFRKFLHQYSVIGLAIGVVMGTAINNLVQAIVQGVLTPLIGLIVPSEKFQALVVHARGVDFRFGDVVSALLHFVIVSLLIYFTVRYLLRQEELLHKR